MKSKNNTLHHLGYIALAFVGLASNAAYAANTTWVGNTDANFGTLANWNSVTPTGNSPFFGVAGTAGTTLNNNIVGGTYWDLVFNSGASAYTIEGNSFTLPSNRGIANNSSSLQTINTNITLANTAHGFYATSGDITLGGNLSGTTGTLTFAGVNTTTLGGTNTLNTSGANFAGLVVGGSGATAGNVSITGATTVNGGAVTTDSRGILDIHGASTLTIQAGGSLTMIGSSGVGTNSIIGQDRTGTSTLRVNGGSLTLNANHGFILGNNRTDATGVLTVSSGTATIAAGSTTLQNPLNFIALGRDGANGIVNLDGGTLATGRQFVRDGSSGGTGLTGAGTGTANVNFNGGTLKALADQTSGNGWFETATTGNFQVVTTTVKAGGAKIDTNGFTTNINTVLAHDSGLGGTADGGLTKSGSGTLTLGAANSYTGKTTITGGTLALGSGGSIANSTEIALNGGNFNVTAVAGYSTGASQALTGSGSITGDITVTGTLAIGNSPGTMTFNDDLTIGSSAVSNFEFTDIAFGSGTYDLAQGGDGSQAVTFGGTLNLFFSGGTYANNSTVQIFDFDVDNYFANFDSVISYGLGSGQSAVFNASTGFVTVIPEPGAALLGGLGMLALLRRRRN